MKDDANTELSKVVVDKFLLEDFMEYLIENYHIESARKRWIIHGTDTSHSFLNRDTQEPFLIQDIAEEYATKKGFKLPDVFNSEFINNL